MARSKGMTGRTCTVVVGRTTLSACGIALKPDETSVCARCGEYHLPVYSYAHSYVPCFWYCVVHGEQGNK
jgi:hypothetical protein